MKSFKVTRKRRGNKGFYTIEGAMTIVVFTALIMMLLSLITLVRLETVIQSALNETAMGISQYSYEVVKYDSSSEKGDANESSIVESIIGMLKGNMTSSVTGPEMCRQIFKTNIDIKDYDSWLIRQGVENGYKGLKFNESRVLCNDDYVSVVVTYTVKVNTYGLFDKELHIRQCANTRAWLPIGVNILSSDNRFDENSIWSKDPLERGRYFVLKIKSENGQASVLSGQGIDLYFKNTRKAIEIYSMNLFSSSYSSDDLSVPHEENISKQLEEYAIKFDEDLERAERLIQMEDGSLCNYGRLNEKEILLVVPKEVESLGNFKLVLEKQGHCLMAEHGITLTVEYREEALL